ncbi:MAG: hypothetical protein JM58_09135 [Peptococcaceae bacterium BICA1-8]|nr:MAG: hypothetical protein JM58_09135 [Peptococcaceae bacterium BICA1-8]
MPTKIEWATETWNPVTGCTKISEGCQNCYAERLTKRFWPDKKFSEVKLHPDRLDQPLKWTKPRKIFVCSMSDLFHDDVNEGFLCRVFDTMMASKNHTFLVLTKRPERMRDFLKRCVHGEIKNIWYGVTAENQRSADERIPILLQISAAVRFVSVEPMLGPINLQRIEPKDKYDVIIHALSGEYAVPFTVLKNRPKLDWVICGGESGPGARPMHPDWARSLRDQCQEAGVPFFFKQWGEFKEVRRYHSFSKYADTVARISRVIGSIESGRSALLNANGSKLVNGGPEHKVYPISHLERVGKKEAGKLLDGQIYDEYPESKESS